MRVIYRGPHDEVEVSATGHVAKRDGDPIDVPDDLGRSLVQQDAWSRLETDDERKARVLREKDEAAQDKAAQKAADEARKRVAAEQAKRNQGGN